MNEAFAYLYAHGIIIRDGEIEGEPAYRLSDQATKVILGLYDMFRTMKDDKPENPLLSSVMMTILGLTDDGFEIQDIHATANVLYSFAEKLVKS